MDKRHHLIVALLIITISFHLLPACTTGLAGTGAAKHGHVLLWKNRDTGFTDNELAFFRKDKFRFIGLINKNDTTQVWAGINNYGFAIINAESRDMAVPGEPTEYDDEGYLMKMALQRCQTVEDFEKMLRESNGAGRRVTSNFGVIDAAGGAAFFETGNHEYIRCNIPDSEKHNFLIRANFAYNARSSEGYGHVRHDRALTLFNQAVEKNILDYHYVISTVSEDIDLPDSLLDFANPVVRKTRDTINRYRTAAAVVFDAFPSDDRKNLTTFWCALGEPVCSVSVPLWVASGRIPEDLNGPDGAALNVLFQTIKTRVYDDEDHINLDKYYYVRKILDRGQKKIFKCTDRELKRWRKNSPSPDEIARFQEKMVSIAVSTARRTLRYLHD